MKNKFTLYVLHSSHTDVGYTDTQEKMKAHHISFIRRALKYIEREPRFVWNCESYWCVRQFLSVCSQREREAFVKAVQNKNIGLSASYLNLTDLTAQFVHDEIAADCVSQRTALGLSCESAMTADVNGYGWGFVDVLAKQGVKHLMSSIHTHHGYHPLFRKQTAFWWESPTGSKLLVWNGEHYNLGNELGIAGTSSFEYTLHDGLSFAPLSDEEKADARIKAYVDTILNDGYEYSFAPVCVSSYMTDNAPPSLKVLQFIDEFNTRHTDIELKMVTLDEFFSAVSNSGVALKAYRGDWTDWWADGVASTPSDLVQYRSASRGCHIAQKLRNRFPREVAPYYSDAIYNLMFYSEHTWGYSSSITEPYHPQVNRLGQWKRLYALKAEESAVKMLEGITAQLGETAVCADGELKFKAVNPHSRDIIDMLVLDVEHFYGHECFEIVDECTNAPVPFQISSYSRGPEICILLKLAANESKTFKMRELPAKALPSAGLCAQSGIEGVNDLYWRTVQDLENGGCITTQGIENKFFKITFTQDIGITSIYDKEGKRELVNSAYPYAAFTPIYEVTQPREGEDMLFVRRNMGRNRKAFRTIRSVGRLYDVRVLENGVLYSRAELLYEMDGVKNCSVIITSFKHMPKLDVKLRVHKTSVWEPENLYLSLAFNSDETWIDKAGAIFRPRIDQLPGTCTDFYAIQNAIVFSGKRPIILCCPDTPLVWLGTLCEHPIKLMGEEAPNCDETYSWVMNNFWETNFNANLGGFYQFCYTLSIGENADVSDAFSSAEAQNEGVLQFYMFEHNEEDSDA